jgi:hypothetical protein
MYHVSVNESIQDRINFQETEALLSMTYNVVQQKDRTVGKKTLGNFFSFLFIVNQIYGPGVLAIPIVFQQGMQRNTHH